ncbi:18731_t:CDS:2, partial [Acaulospora morrowiae]
MFQETTSFNQNINIDSSGKKTSIVDQESDNGADIRNTIKKKLSIGKMTNSNNGERGDGSNNIGRKSSKSSKSRGLRKRWSDRKRKNQSIDRMISLGEAYFIIHSCVDEIVSRGLTEPDIFHPLKTSDGGISEVKYLINCLLQDNKVEFDDELKCQDIRNIAALVRWTLRNCTERLITVGNYEEFVRIEQESKYDTQKEIFTRFLKTLSRQSQDILLDLFNLFSQILLQSQINKMSVHRLIKSLCFYIIDYCDGKNGSGEHAFAAEKQDVKRAKKRDNGHDDDENDHQNFIKTYYGWLKSSDACIHLFLAYLREQA